MHEMKSFLVLVVIIFTFMLVLNVLSLKLVISRDKFSKSVSVYEHFGIVSNSVIKGCVTLSGLPELSRI